MKRIGCLVLVWLFGLGVESLEAKFQNTPKPRLRKTNLQSRKRDQSAAGAINPPQAR
jgi:hypothetical protein